MEKDDFRHALTFGEAQFGGPPWTEFLPETKVKRLAKEKVVPLMLDNAGAPLRRNFVHVSDLVSAILSAIDNKAAEQQLFNIAMDEPVDYGDAARYLKDTRGYSAIEIHTDLFSNWLDNAKARLKLSWRPSYDLKGLIEDAWNYVRAPNDPRKIWYPG
jgi:nucleoside-diphosphate-sugar epimerase